MPELPASTDVAIVGAGAAGLAAAIFARRLHPGARVIVLDGARRPGAKILVSGGGRCNVTNASVAAADFWGGKSTIVRRVLKALPVATTVAFFSELGVPLHEEADGKLFPDSNRARDVLDVLLREAAATGVVLVADTRVREVVRQEHGFVVRTSRGQLRATSVVLATGGRSLPKTGSDGGGYLIAATLGHTLVPQTPALAPLLLENGTRYSIHERLAGVAVDGEIAVWIGGALATRLRGALLWTHFGISGPLALNTSRHWARATLEGRIVRLALNFYPGQSFEAVDARWVDAAAGRARATLRRTLATQVPDAVAIALLTVLDLPADRPLADLTREERRRLVHAVTEWPLAVTETRGYNYAEVTAGGVPLHEVDPSTMESRLCPGLYFAGEILDVDGRIGGFNFQWAWCTAAIVGRAVAAGATDTADALS